MVRLICCSKSYHIIKSAELALSGANRFSILKRSSTAFSASLAASEPPYCFKCAWLSLSAYPVSFEDYFYLKVVGSANLSIASTLFCFYSSLSSGIKLFGEICAIVFDYSTLSASTMGCFREELLLGVGLYDRCTFFSVCLRVGRIKFFSFIYWSFD